MTSPFKDIGVSKADITAIYKQVKLSHDIPLTPKKYKKDVRDAIYNGGMAISICKNGKIGIIEEYRGGTYECRYYHVSIIDQGNLVDTHSGPISNIMSYFPNGTYYAYDTTIEENRPKYFHRKMHTKPKDTKTVDIEKFIEDIEKRVRPLLDNTLKYRGDELAEQIKAAIEAKEDGYDIKKTKDSYYSISKIDIYKDEDFDLIINNFKKVASLYKKEEIDKHLGDVIHTLTMCYFGEAPAVSTYSSRKDFITNNFREGNSRSLVLKRTEKTLNDNMQGEHCWGNPKKPKPRMYGSMVKDISYNVIWFYKRLINEDREVKFWPYNDAGPREVR